MWRELWLLRILLVSVYLEYLWLDFYVQGSVKQSLHIFKEDYWDEVMYTFKI